MEEKKRIQLQKWNDMRERAIKRQLEKKKKGLTLKGLKIIWNKVKVLDQPDNVWVTPKVANLLTKRPRRAVKVKRVKQVPLRRLILKADKLLSVYVRQRDGNKCVLCGSTNNSTNGHLIKRGKKPVRWSEDNCFCLCSICNFRDKVDTNYHGRYVAWYIERFGLEKYKELEIRAEVKVDSVWIRNKCEEVIKKYEATSST